MNNVPAKFISVVAIFLGSIWFWAAVRFLSMPETMADPNVEGAGVANILNGNLAQTVIAVILGSGYFIASVLVFLKHKYNVLILFSMLLLGTLMNWTKGSDANGYISLLTSAAIVVFTFVFKDSFYEEKSD